MKTIRTILATFGITSLLYGVFALIAKNNNWAFTGRSIYQLFHQTGFIALVIGIGCVLSFVIMTVAIVSFRDDGARRKHDYSEDDPEADFLEEETVPEERAEEADETWSPEIKRKQRRALYHTDEEVTPDLFADEPENVIPIRSEEPPRPVEQPRPRMRSTFRQEAAPEPEMPVLTPVASGNVQEPVFAAEEIPTVSETPAPKVRWCIYCGKPIEKDSAFCIYCGKRV